MPDELFGRDAGSIDRNAGCFREEMDQVFDRDAQYLTMLLDWMIDRDAERSVRKGCWIERLTGCWIS